MPRTASNTEHDGVAEKTCKKLAALAVCALLDEAAFFPKPGLVDPISQGAHTDMDFTLLIRSAACLEHGFYRCAHIGYRSTDDASVVCGAHTGSGYTADGYAAAAQMYSAAIGMHSCSTPAAHVQHAYDSHIQRPTGGIPVKQVRKKLQHIGLALEHTMFTETGGINTHKGSIFIFAYLLAAAGRLFCTDTLPNTIGTTASCSDLIIALCDEVAVLAAGISAHARVQLSSKQDYTHGEHVFLQYGCTGIRGEVEAGLPLVKQYTAYLRNIQTDTAYHRIDAAAKNSNNNIKVPMTQREAYLYTLLGIISKNEDTNVLYRAGHTGLQQLQARCAAIIASGIRGKNLYRTVEALDSYCIERHISPGGSADLFAAVLFCQSLAELVTHGNL